MDLLRERKGDRRHVRPLCQSNHHLHFYEIPHHHRHHHQHHHRYEIPHLAYNLEGVLMHRVDFSSPSLPLRLLPLLLDLLIAQRDFLQKRNLESESEKSLFIANFLRLMF